jgi:carboxy-terminal domain RNA polymerase II polypeptide A small phosphatase
MDKLLDSKDKILVVLDLDETLIHSTDNSITEYDFEVFHYKVRIRPFLLEFLEVLKVNFKVAVWSSASDDYVCEIVKRIFPVNYPLEFVWGRSKCTFKANYNKVSEMGYLDYSEHLEYIKRVSKIKRSFNHSLERVLIIDDTPRKAIHNYGNAIYPSEFKGDKNDNELLLLSEYLNTLKDVDNVRAIEKRFWKSSTFK